MTPAQASGHPDFVTDVPVQGPTDPGIRTGDCWYAKNRLPAEPACVDCSGPVPQWARNSLCPGNRLTNSGLGEGFMETISHGGVRLAGYGLSGPSDPDVFASLSPDQQSWVKNSLVTLNNSIVKANPGSACPSWVDPGVNLKAAVGCIQMWWNNAIATPHGPGKVLRTDGALDEDTLCALVTVASLHPKDFTAPFPDPQKQHCQPAQQITPSTGSGTTKKLSTGAMVGIGVAGAAVVGGIAYAATRPKKRARR